MSTKLLRIASVLVLAVVLPGSVFWWMKKPPPGQRSASVEGTPAREAAHGPAASGTPIPSPSLVDRKDELLRMSPAEAREWILIELEGGKDYPTGSDLAIGTDQNLSSWPSYRVYLLDVLHLVDPVAAAHKSREIIESSKSPDEWAVALRNVARADDTGTSTEWLRMKSAELLRNGEWRSDPSAGYLNAFDVIVHTGHTDLAPELLALCEDLDQRAVRHASFLALDRLVQRDPEALLPVLANAAIRYSKSGRMVSNMMARADLRDPGQRGAVERYLLDGARTEEELTSFVSVFPNANFHISNNLLTKTEGIDGVELQERDQAALAVIGEWLGEARFSGIHPALLQVQAKLEGFIGE